MDKVLQPGSIFILDNTWVSYLIWYCVGLAIFMSFFFISDCLFVRFGFQSYIENDIKGRLKLRCAMMGNLHHFVIISLAFYMLATRCSESDNYPVHDSNAKSFVWFSSDMC